MDAQHEGRENGRKLGLLVGVSGAGKSTIADAFSRDVCVIRFDAVIRKANLILCPYLKDERLWSPFLLQRLDGFIRGAEFAVAQAIDLVTKGKLVDGRPILAEGGSLSHPWWEAHFIAGLKTLGVQIESTQMFWHRPDKDVVLQHYQSRHAEQSNEDLRTSEQKIAVFNANLAWRLKARVDVRQTQDYDETLSAIAEFFSIELRTPQSGDK